MFILSLWDLLAKKMAFVCAVVHRDIDKTLSHYQGFIPHHLSSILIKFDHRTNTEISGVSDLTMSLQRAYHSSWARCCSPFSLPTWYFFWDWFGRLIKTFGWIAMKFFFIPRVPLTSVISRIPSVTPASRHFSHILKWPYNCWIGCHKKILNIHTPLKMNCMRCDQNLRDSSESTKC